MKSWASSGNMNDARWKNDVRYTTINDVIRAVVSLIKGVGERSSLRLSSASYSVFGDVADL
jgi:hypothetical protein